MKKPEKTASGTRISFAFYNGADLKEIVSELENVLDRSLTFEEIMRLEIDPDGHYFDATLTGPPVDNPNYEEQMREYELQKKIQDARNVISNTSPSKIVELENQIKNAKKDREKALETLKELGIEENYHNLMEKS